jgi:hypothetical protein
MPITKVFPGRRTVMPVFCLISVLLVFVSCRQTVDFAESYDVTFSNGISNRLFQ